MQGYLASNKKYYDRQYSEGYDTQVPENHIVRIYKRILRGRVNRKLLDFGCGTGANARYFKANGFEVYGVDISKIAIKKCNDKNFKVIKPGGSIHFKTNFDVIIANQSLYYLDNSDFKRCISELYNRLNEGGYIVATMMGMECYYSRLSTPYKNGLRKVTLKGRIKGASYINFTSSE